MYGSITRSTRTSGRHPRNSGHQRTTFGRVTPVPPPPRRFPARLAGGTEGIRIVEPPCKAVCQSRDVARTVANSARAEVLCQHVLTGRIGDHDRQTSKWIRERLVRQRQFLVWYAHLFGRQPDVETTARINENIGIDWLVVGQRQRGCKP